MSNFIWQANWRRDQIATVLEDGGLTALDKVVLTAMVNGAACIGGRWMYVGSAAELARSVGQSWRVGRRSQMYRVLRKLIANRYLVRIKRGRGPGKHSAYQIVFGRCADMNWGE